MGTLIDIDDYRRIWHAAELECPHCRTMWLGAVHLATVTAGNAECPACGRLRGRVLHFDDRPMRLRAALNLAGTWDQG